MKEIIFLVEDAAEDGFTAKSLGDSIYTNADTVAELHNNVRDAVACHFTDTEKPSIIRLHFLRDFYGTKIFTKPR
jgi:hypothetical protein